MADFILSCCSTADLTAEQLSERDIKVMPFHFTLGDTQYLDDLGKTIGYEEFYARMAQGEMTMTSQPNAEEYIEHAEPYLKEGKDILHLTLSSGISGALNSATIAAGRLREMYPERKIIVIDSLAASSGYGLLMDKLADQRDEGMGIDELAAWAKENRLRANHWFFSTDLTYFVRGGRVSPVSGFVGNALRICPLLNVDHEGKLIPREKIRSKKKTMKRTVEVMLERADGGAAYDGKVFISNAACAEDAEHLAQLITEAMPNTKGKIIINSIGTTIGSHTGPGTVALFFWGKKREN